MPNNYFHLPAGTIIGNPLYYPVTENERIEWRKRTAHPDRFVAQFPHDGGRFDGQLSLQCFSAYKIFWRFAIPITKRQDVTLDYLITQGLAQRQNIVEAYNLQNSVDIDLVPLDYQQVGVITSPKDVFIYQQQFDSQGRPINDECAVNVEDDPERAWKQILKSQE